MNRRRLLATIAAALVVGPPPASAKRVPPKEFEAEDFASVSYSDGMAEEEIRSLWARVSVWADEDAAEEHRQFTIAGAGSDLPDGEFYQTDPVARPLPAELAGFPATLMGWSTTVGVAAYHTEWALLSVRRQTLVWELRVSGAEMAPVLELAATLAVDLTSREHPAGGDLLSLLPDEDEAPAGLSLEYRFPEVATPAP